MRDLAYQLLDNISSLYTVNSLTGYLKSRGHKAPKTAVSQYLDWFEDAFFLFSVRLFDASLSRSNTNPKKIYCVDHALVTSISSGILTNAGHLLENLVFSALRSISDSIYYYRTRNGKEVDFIIPLQDGTKLLIQVCETLADPATRKRELNALGEAMEELGCPVETIVTRTEEERIELKGRLINVMPTWKWLLALV